MSVDAGNELDQLIAGQTPSGPTMQPPGTTPSGDWGMGHLPIESRVDNRIAAATLAGIKNYKKYGFDVEGVQQAVMQQTMWQDQLAQNIAVNGTPDGAAVAQRLHQMGLAFPWLPADGAVGLASAGASVGSPATVAAATASAAQPPPTATQGDNPIVKSTLSMTDAVDYASTNSDLASVDLLQQLIKRGFNPMAVTAYSFDPNSGQFFASTDTSVPVDLHTVLQTELSLHPTDEGMNIPIVSSVLDATRATSRWAFAGVQSIWQGYSGAERANYEHFMEDGGGSFMDKIASIAGAGIGYGWSEGYDETTFAEALRQTGQGVDAGNGWFMGGSVQANQEARVMAQYADQMSDGSPSTPGRLLASIVSSPGSTTYNLTSGFIDAGGALALDPTSYAGVGIYSRAVVSGTRAFSSTAKALEWSKGTASVARTGAEVVRPVEDLADETLRAAAHTDRAPAWFPDAETVPRAADQAVSLEQVTPRLYAGGTAHTNDVVNLLTHADDAEVSGLRLSTEKSMVDGAAVRVELDPTGLPGYVDTGEGFNWAEEVKRGASSKIVPVATAGGLRSKISAIVTTAEVPPSSKLAGALDTLVNDRGWIRRPTRDGARYTPPQVKADGAGTASPFTVDEQGRAILAPWAERIDNNIGNWTSHVFGDLSGETLLSHFPEHVPLRTEEVYDRNPLRLVTDGRILTGEPEQGLFRVRYGADGLQGKVITAEDELSTRQLVHEADPEQPWPKEKPPVFDEEKTRANVQRDYADARLDEGGFRDAVRKNPYKLPKKFDAIRERGLKAVMELFDRLPDELGGIPGRNRAEMYRFADSGEMRLSDYLVEDTERRDALAFGPESTPYADVEATSIPPQTGAADTVLKNYQLKEVDYTEYLAWKKANPAAAKAERDAGFTIMDHSQPGKRWLVKLPKGVTPAKAKVEMPWVKDYGTPAQIREHNAELDASWGEDAEHYDTYKSIHDERMAEWEAIPDPKPIYSAEIPDPAKKVGEADPTVGDGSLLDFATYGTRNLDQAKKAGRPVTLKWIPRSGGKPPRVLDLDTEDGFYAVQSAATAWTRRVGQYLGRDGFESFNTAYKPVRDADASMMTGGELLTAIRKADTQLSAQLGDHLQAAARLEDELIDGLRSGRWDAVEQEDVIHGLDATRWRRVPVRGKDVPVRHTSFDEGAATGKFTVGVSGKQEVLRRGLQGIVAPMGRGPIPKATWDAWKVQRAKLIDNGWTVKETTPGRETLSRPVSDEYSKADFDDLTDVTGEHVNTQTPEQEAAGLVKDAYEPFVVPQRFVNYLRSRAGKARVEKIAKTHSAIEMKRLLESGGHQQKNEVMADLLAASTPEQVEAVLLNHVGAGKVTSLQGQGKTLHALEDMADPVARNIPVIGRPLRDVRFTHLMPGSYVDLDDGEQALAELDKYMVNARLPAVLRDDLLKEMYEQRSRFGRYQIMKSAAKVVESHIAVELERGFFKGQNAADVQQIARNATTFFANLDKEARAYAIKVHGENAYIPGAKFTSDDMVQASPQLMSEFLNRALPLPNAREIKRMTSAIGRFTAYGMDTSREKVLRGILVGGDWYNRLFKLTALARIAYPVRVGMEEQARQMFSGYDSFYNHPLSMLMTVSHKRAGMDAFGNRFGHTPIFHKGDLAADPEPTAYSESLANNAKMWDDPRSIKVVGGNYRVVTMADDGYFEGWAFELGKLHADPMARRLAGGFKDVERASMPEEVLAMSPKDKVVWWLGNHPKGQEYLRAMREADPDLALRLSSKDGVGSFVDDIRIRLDYATAQNKNLYDAVANGAIPYQEGHVPLYLDVPGGYDNNKKFLTALKSHSQMEGRPNAVITHDLKIAAEKSQTYDKAVGRFFMILQGKPTNTLARSPVFRTSYWDNVAHFTAGGDAAARNAILRNAQKANVDPETMSKIMKSLNAKIEGHLTLEDIDGIAKAQALENTRTLLYDTARRHQIWDSLRIVTPFGEAWHEVMTSWARMVAKNPKTLDRLAQLTHGAQQPGSNAIYEATGVAHDPNQGFFYKDNRTGVDSFAYPMNGLVNKYLTHGLPISDAGVLWGAPVGGLNLIGQMYPGFGTVITAPAQVLLDGTQFEGLKNFLAPFGGPSMEESGGLGNALVDSVTPAWVRKLLTGTMPITPEQKSQLASAQMSGMIFLMSSGKYDLSTPEDMDRLLAQGKTLGERLYQLRALGQFVLPTMGAPELAALTSDGELVLQSKLADMYRQYTADPEQGGYGYNDGMIAFLRDFGSDLYLMGTSKTASNGFAQPTRGTYDWMKDHSDLVRKYPEVYGLLVTDDTEGFYYPAYQLQVNIGSRVGIDPRDFLEAANDRLGGALYASYKAKYGDNPSDSEQAALTELNQKLSVQFPGYSAIPSNMGETDHQIRQLMSAVKDPSMSGTPLGKTMAAYFDVRDAYRATGIVNFNTEAGRPAAADLYQLGQSLVASNPDFEIAWTWLLQRELGVDSLTGVTQ